MLTKSVLNLFYKRNNQLRTLLYNIFINMFDFPDVIKKLAAKNSKSKILYRYRRFVLTDTAKSDPKCNFALDWSSVVVSGVENSVIISFSSS